MTYEEKIKQKAMQFVVLCTQYEEMNCFMKELTATTKGKSFRIQNSFVWEMLISHRNILFINVAEWIDSFAIGDNNFLSDLMSHHLPDIRVLSKRERIRRGIKSISAASTADEIMTAHWLEHVDKYVQHFFGNCQQSPPHQVRLCNCDINLLINKFKDIHKRIADARHMNAHPYDGIVNHQNISLKDVGTAIDDCRELLGIISTISNVGFGLDSIIKLSETSAEVYAKDIVDQVLCGGIHQIAFIKQDMEKPFHRTVGKNRQEFYDKLHKFHDDCLSLDPNYKKLFNDHDSAFFQFSKMHGGLFGPIEEAV